MNRSHLENYAELAVDACIGLKDPRGLLIHGEVPHREVALVFAEAAQQRTQAPVRVLLDDSLDFARIIRGGQLDQIEAANRLLRAAFEEVIQNHWAVVALRGEEDLELMGRLAEEHPEAFDVFNAGRSDAITMWRKYGIGRGYCPWTLLGVPTANLAKASFPARNEQDGIEALWELWFKFTFADQDNFLDAAKAHWAKLNARARLLNDLRIREVHVVGPETDLWIGFHELANWLSGPKPGDLQPGPNNHPTEESFTTPDWRTVHGTVQATMPFMAGSAGRFRVDGLKARFEGGRMVEFGATEGEAAFKKWVDQDAAGRQLGEFALVGDDSPIFQSGIFFSHTLFDENARPHIALGMGYAAGVKDGQQMSAQEREAAGINDSKIHTAFMIGGPDVSIIATQTNQGEKVLIENGTWMEPFLDRK